MLLEAVRSRESDVLFVVTERRYVGNARLRVAKTSFVRRPSKHCMYQCARFYRLQKKNPSVAVRRTKSQALH